MKLASLFLILSVAILTMRSLSASPLVYNECVPEGILEGDAARIRVNNTDPAALSHPILTSWSHAEGRYTERHFYIHVETRIFFLCSSPAIEDWKNHLSCRCRDGYWQFHNTVAGPNQRFTDPLKILYREDHKIQSRRHWPSWRIKSD